MKTENLKRAARRALLGSRRIINMGRSRHTAGVTWSTPVRIVEGAAPPVLDGLPYLKTQFRGSGGFCKTLYTPSTMCIVVGSEWCPGTNQ